MLTEEIIWWTGFHLLIFTLLLLDLGVFHRKARAVQTKEAFLWSAVWVFISLAFNGLIYWLKGRELALQFFTGYLIEKTLSIDNIFVFVLIFSFFKITPTYQHKVLYWGILGALVMRICFILAGVALIQKFHFMIYLFGAFLCYSAIKFVFQKEKKMGVEESFLVKLCKKFFPVVTGEEGGKFFVRKRGKTAATSLFLVLLMIESSDFIFALDSIPAIFAVSSDPFIIYTSNIFAILGLRSLYFVLAHSLQKFRYLKIGLALILLFIGLKMVLSSFYSVSSHATLLVVLCILLATFLFSFFRPFPGKK